MEILRGWHFGFEIELGVSKRKDERKGEGRWVDVWVEG